MPVSALENIVSFDSARGMWDLVSASFVPQGPLSARDKKESPSVVPRGEQCFRNIYAYKVV